VRRHGGQAQGGAQADAMKGHLIDAVFHRAKASFRCVSRRVHLVCQLLNQRLQPSRPTGITEQRQLVQD
jgi:hypothetical protein